MKMFASHQERLMPGVIGADVTLPTCFSYKDVLTVVAFLYSPGGRDIISRLSSLVNYRLVAARYFCFRADYIAY